jgi:hypothetical protein
LNKRASGYNGAKTTMKKLITVFLALGLAFGAANSAAQSRASRSNPVLDAMIEALGGQTFLDVKEIHTSGRFFSFSKGDLSGSDHFEDYIKMPDMERTEFGANKNKLEVTINRGKEGWKVVGKKEVEPQPVKQTEDFLANFKTSFDYVIRYALQSPQTTIQNLPTELIDFKRADVVEIRDSTKNLMRFYVDRATHLPIKMQVRRANQTAINEELYSNWHKFQGVMTPLLVSRSTNGVKTMEIRAEMAVYNPGFPDTLFAPPVSK